MKRISKLICIVLLITGICLIAYAVISSNTSTHDIEIVETVTPLPIKIPIRMNCTIAIEKQPIELLMEEIVTNDVCNKSAYAIDTERGSDVYCCIHLACEQAEYLKSKGYDAGVIIIWNKHAGMSHAQTWMIIDNERYILESVYDRFWTEEDHRDEFSNRYKICFMSIQKGREWAKVSSEVLHR